MSSSAAQSGDPADPARRVSSLDLLRGFALLGMFVVHFHDQSNELEGVQDFVRTLIWRLVETKSHGTFALLFGAGFAIQLRRAQARGTPFVARYLRRLAILAVFGIIAHGLFGYNVLVSYAFMGVPLLLLHRLSTKVLIAMAIVLTMTVPVYVLTWRHLSGEDAARARQVAAAEVMEAIDEAERGNSFSALVSARLRHMNWFHSQPFFFIPGATLALFLVGLLMIRHRIFERPQDHTVLLLWMIVFGSITWALANWGGAWTLWASHLGLIRDQWLTLSYVAVALLAITRWPDLARKAQPIADAGRLALTNYLLQIAVIDLMFSGYGLGLGEILPTNAFMTALACFTIEVAFSAWWLRRFRYGPAEWVWRTLTDVRPISLRTI